MVFQSLALCFLSQSFRHLFVGSMAAFFMDSLHGLECVLFAERACAFAVKLNGNRQVTGVLRGFDQFMNVVLDNTVEHLSATEANDIGMVVSFPAPPRAFVSQPRGTKCCCCGMF